MDRRDWMFAAPSELEQVVGALSTRFTVQAEPATRSVWTGLDTADWRLHRAGMTLRDARHAGAAELVLMVDHTERVAAPTRVSTWPRLVDDLPPSVVRERIARAVGVRALLPLARVERRSTRLRLTDDIDKTRVRVRIDQQSLVGTEHRPLPLRVVLSPLRGYERDANRCSELLTEMMTPLDPDLAPATVAMAAAGYSPGQPAVPALRLDPSAPAVESLARVLTRWADTIDAARPGVLDDIDAEYLHELRTAVRATRSILSSSGDLLPSSQAARFAGEFAWLGSLTTPLRDLDVYLLELAGRGAVDVAGLDDLDPLRRHLTARRRQALATVRDGLRSRRGETLTADWRRALGTLTVPELSSPKTVETAVTQAQVAYRRIRKAAVAVTADTPADDLHRLRRRCKRMRYLIDSYASVYQRDPYRDLLRRLKMLQDCLGHIQDSEVQRQDLAVIAATLTGRRAPVSTVLAMGALRERNAARDAAARHRLADQLPQFCAPATQAMVHALAVPPP